MPSVLTDRKWAQKLRKLSNKVYFRGKFQAIENEINNGSGNFDVNIRIERIFNDFERVSILDLERLNILELREYERKTKEN